MTDMRRTPDGAFVDPTEAMAELVHALAGVELGTCESRIVDWLLLTCDQPTLHHLSTLIGKLRGCAA